MLTYKYPSIHANTERKRYRVRHAETERQGENSKGNMEGKDSKGNMEGRDEKKKNKKSIKLRK
jgi:hypothetical protein